MPELIVINKGLLYDGKAYGVGQTLVATPVDAAYLKKARKAVDAPAPEPVGKVATVRAAPVVHEAPVAPIEAAVAPLEAGDVEPEGDDAPKSRPHARGAYSTRRLKAED